MSRGLNLLLVTCLLACGRVSYDPRGDWSGLQDGATPDGNPSGDAAQPVEACDWTRPFTFVDVVPLSEVNSSATEQELWLRSDLLYGTFYRFSDSTMYEMTRSSPEEPFGAPTPMTGVLVQNRTIRVTLSHDLLRAYICSNAGRPDYDVQMSVRESVDDAFSAPEPMSLSVEGNDWDPFESASGLELYTATQPIDGSEGDLYVATRETLTEPFGPLALVSVSSTAASEGNPVLNEAGTVLVWNRYENGNSDLFYATRASTSDEFTFAGPVPGINTADNQEGELHISPDGCDLWFGSDDPRGLGGVDYYHASFSQL